MARKRVVHTKKRKKSTLGAELFQYVQERTQLLNNPCAEISTLKKKLKALLNLEKSSLKNRRI